MRKKLGIILAILLCAAMIFTFVACNNTPGPTNNPEDPATVLPDGDALAGVSDADKEAVNAKIKTFVESWLSNHAEMPGSVTDQTDALKTAIVESASEFRQKKANGKYAMGKTPNVTFDASVGENGKYTITYSWKDTAYTYTFQADAQTDTYQEWAGAKIADYNFVPTQNASKLKMDQFVTALTKVVNNVAINAKTGKFGADTVIGVDVAGHKYGLRVMGNVDVNQRDGNEIGIALVDVNANNKVLGGIYYQAAETAKDSKFYLQYSETDPETDKLKVDEEGNIVYTYRYIDYADVYGWIGAEDLAKKAEAGSAVIALENGGEVNSFAKFLQALGAKPAIGDIVAPVVSSLITPYEKGNETLLVLNLGDVLKEVATTVSGLPEDTLSMLMPILDAIGLDLGSMHGLKGYITIGYETDATTGELSNFALSVNIPECEFYKSDKVETPIPIPAISFSIYLNDFSFVSGEKTIAGVIPEGVSAARKFSPTNMDLSGDVYVYVNENEDDENAKPFVDSVFRFRLITDINPLEIIENGDESDSLAVLTITQSGEDGEEFVAEGATNFLSIGYSQKDQKLLLSGTAFDDAGTDVYYFLTNTKKSMTDTLWTWLGLTGHGLDYSEEDGLTIVDESKAKPAAIAILKNALAEDLMTYYKNYRKEAFDAKEKEIEAAKNAEDQTAAQENGTEGGEGAAEASFNPADIPSYFSAFKALYEKFVAEGKFDFGTEGGFYAKAEVSIDMINEVIVEINKIFSVTFDPISDPEYVNAYINYGTDYKKMGVVEVKVDGNEYKLVVDLNGESAVITFTFTIPEEKDAQGNVVQNKRTYEVAVSGATSKITFRIMNAEGAVAKKYEVGFSNFDGCSWGKDYSTDAKAAWRKLDGVEKEHKVDFFNGKIAGQEVSAATVVVSGVMDILNSENVLPLVKKLGHFVIEQVVDAQVEDAYKPAPATPVADEDAQNGAQGDGAVTNNGQVG